MFCDFGVKTCNKFLGNDEFRKLSTKRERIHYVLKRFDIDLVIQSASTKVLERCQKGRKFSDVADHYLHCAKTIYSSNSQDQIRKARTDASKAILHAQFGGDDFVKAFHLRSKCFLKLSEYEDALLDTEVAIKYGGFDVERVLFKAICLFSLNRFKLLKDYFRTIDMNSDDFKEFDDMAILEELGLTHLTFAYLREFVNDPNFANQTIKPSDSRTNPGVLYFMEPLISFMKNYKMDSRCEIRNDDYKGRHFMAKDCIEKGTTILVERSYSLALDPDSQMERCLYCLKSCSAFIPCKHCTEAIFCSEECLDHAWDKFHRYECTLLGIFKDSFNVSLHMYRTISIIGAKQALLVEKDLKDQRDQWILDNSNNSANDESSENLEKQAKTWLNEKTINDFLKDLSLQNTPNYKFSEEQLKKVYLMNQALIDHDDAFEDYYDVFYMGISIDVALLLLLHQFLSEDIDLQQESGPIWDHLKLKQAEKLTDLENESPFLSSTVDDFIRLISIVQLNIRKLVTNVFSWNIYDDNYRVTKSVASCQCLVGSLINHSCDPNVEWDFRNGCIVYTALRDIEKGEEINNSYGPHKGVYFIDRQNLLSNNYYFNCRCNLCQMQVANYPHVLGCLSCGGPVVCLTELVVPANCMTCLTDYPHVHHRMKKVNQARIKFKCLLHFFQDQPFGGSINDELATYFDELISTMDYQLSYCYLPSVQFQTNLQAFCRLLYRLGKHDKACYYGQHQQIDENEHSEVASEDIMVAVAKLENSTFWFQLYHNYVRQYNDANSKRSTSADSESTNLLDTARELVAHHFGLIQKGVLQLSKQLDKDSRTNKEEIEGDEGEMNFQDLLDATCESDNDESGGQASVKHLLSDILHSCSTLYCNQSSVEQ